MKKDFVNFLQDIMLAIEEIKLRNDVDFRENGPFQRANPSILPSRRTILIGIGRNDVTSCEGICLNNKIRHEEIKWPLRSVTELVIQATETMLGDWRRNVGDCSNPADFFRNMTFFVEDCSPDSCMGLLLLLARINDVPMESVPREWLDTITRWEQGEVLATPDPVDSYGALHNALVHRLLISDWTAAWIDGLRLMISAITNASPLNMSKAASTPELATARAFLEFERQSYLNALAQAKIVQLLLPMQGVEERYRLVDALFLTGQVPSDGYKTFARNDRVNAPLGEGFALQAIYRPEDRGYGDMVISVRPEAKLQLRDLWSTLEAAEEAAWRKLGLDRPNTTPRELTGYPDGLRADGSPSPNEPWFDGGDYTLVAAPRAQEGAPEGSRLAWEDVCEIIWSTYDPYRDMQVMSDKSGECSLFQCPHHVFNGAMAQRRHLIHGKWFLKKASQVPLEATPTLKRILAATLRKRSKEDVSPIRFSELFEGHEPTALELPGGFAIIERSGVYAIDDWTQAPLNIEGIANEFAKAQRIIGSIEGTSGKMAAVVGGAHEFLKGSLGLGLRDTKRKETRLLADLTDLKLNMMQERMETQPESFDPDIEDFRHALHDAWGLGDKLDRYYETIAQTTDTLRAHSEFRTNRTIAFLTAYGFPIAVGASLFGFGFEYFSKLEAIGLFLAVVVGGSILIHLYMRRE